MRRTSLLGALAIVGACYTGTSGRDAADADGDGGDDGSGDGGASDGGGDDGADPPQARCESSQIGPRMLRRLTRDELEHTLRDVFALDASWGGVRLGPDPLSQLGFSNDAAMLQVGDQTANDVLDTAIDVATLVTTADHLATTLPCAATTADVACAEPFLASTARRLFRRAPTDAELAAYRTLFTDNLAEAEFAAALRWTLVAMIQSPHALYRSELGSSDDDGFVLGDDELATALAYDYAGTTPSEALLAAAEAGELRDPDTRVQWARELLAAAAGHTQVERFAVEWTGYERVTTATKNDVPEFAAMRTAMQEETRAFVDAVWFDDDGDVRDLLLAPYSIVGPDLAAYYGWPAPAPGERVDRPEAWGLGLLAQGSLLSANAHADASSPTKRGLLVYKRLLCNQVPPPPPGVPPIDDIPIDAGTTRERYEKVHATTDACKACHLQFDPIGFAFEHFDTAGRWRADEHGLVIDATGTMTLATGEQVEFDGLDALATALAERDEATDCASGLAATWVFGGAGGQGCLAEEARTALAAGDIGMIDYLAELARAPHFSRRRAP